MPASVDQAGGVAVDQAFGRPQDDPRPRRPRLAAVGAPAEEAVDISRSRRHPLAALVAESQRPPGGRTRGIQNTRVIAPRPGCGGRSAGPRPSGRRAARSTSRQEGRGPASGNPCMVPANPRRSRPLGEGVAILLTNRDRRITQPPANPRCSVGSRCGTMLPTKGRIRRMSRTVDPTKTDGSKTSPRPGISPRPASRVASPAPAGLRSGWPAQAARPRGSAGSARTRGRAGRCRCSRGSSPASAISARRR